MAAARRLIDIGANLTDPVFQGLYRGSRKHVPDFQQVLSRARLNGVEKVIVTAGCLQDCDEAAKLCQDTDDLYFTVGCHPTRANEVAKATSPEAYIQNLRSFISDNKSKVVAIGELGLDFDRLHFSDKESQLSAFELQFSLSDEFKLPLFLHSRAASAEFADVIGRNRQRFTTGVVHSFDGTAEEARHLIDMGLFIGLNGCSLKTAENLVTVKSLPADKIMLETDAPWCEIKPTHASHKFVQTQFPCVKRPEKWEEGKMVKGRNEPATMVQVLEAVAAIKGLDVDSFAETVYKTTSSVFFP